MLKALLREADNLPAGGSVAQFGSLVRQEYHQHQALLQRVVISLD
ncbi:MAG: hypothetical protein V4795_18110 [Pseudomonadota bacterium]